MANAFKSYIRESIGVAITDAYTVPAATTCTVIGFSLANIIASGVTVTVDVLLQKAAAGTGVNANWSAGHDVYLVKAAAIPGGGSLVVVGGDQKLVLETGDKVKVLSSDASSIDAIVSVLEIS